MCQAGAKFIHEILQNLINPCPGVCGWPLFQVLHIVISPPSLQFNRHKRIIFPNINIFVIIITIIIIIIIIIYLLCKRVLAPDRVVLPSREMKGGRGALR